MLHKKQSIEIHYIFLTDKTLQNNIKLLHRPVSPYKSAELMVLHMKIFPYERGILIEITVYRHIFLFHEPVASLVDSHNRIKTLTHVLGRICQ